MKPTPLVVTVSLGMMLTLSTPAWSDKTKSDRAALAKDATVTIEQAIKTASDKVPGTVVEAELEENHGKTVWEVEILQSDGQILEVHVDAATGIVIDTEAKGHKPHKKDGKKGQ